MGVSRARLGAAEPADRDIECDLAIGDRKGYSALVLRPRQSTSPVRLGLPRGALRGSALHSAIMFWLYAFVAFGSGAFFGYFGLLVFLEFYESQRPGPRAENRRDIQKLINRCALWGAFVIGLISLGLYLGQHAGEIPMRR